MIDLTGSNGSNKIPFNLNGDKHIFFRPDNPIQGDYPYDGIRHLKFFFYFEGLNLSYIDNIILS